MVPKRGLFTRRRVSRAAGLAAAAMLALAGCASSGSGGGGGGFLSGPISSEPVPGEVIGTGAVKVGLLLPLSATGNAGQLAEALKNAADLALRDFKTADIQLLVKDDRGTPQGARAAANAAVSEGAELILGPLFSDSVAGAASAARGVPVIAFSTDTSALGRNVYLLSFLPQGDVDRVIGYAAAKGKGAFAALLPNTAGGALYEAALQRAVAGSGGRIVSSERYELDKVSMQERAVALATLINSNAVDAVFMPDSGDAVPFVAQILAANGVKAGKVAYLGSGQWDDPRITGESNLNGGWFPGPDNSGFNGFASRYKAAFGATPPRTATLAYDATSLAAGLAARFGSDRFSAQNLTNPNGFIGLDGAFRFLANGTSQRGLAIYQIGRGRASVVEAAPRTFGRPGA
jgi:ABC-type branched-subunit amino acid transport system substrate-binding protein